MTLIAVEGAPHARETIIAGEVVRLIGEGRDDVLRFGAGSPFVDLRLPCGGSIDLYVHVDPDPALRAAVDEGPIIEHDVERISHSDTAESLVRKGRDIERRVLARALTWHLEGRVIINGSKTVVFRD